MNRFFVAVFALLLSGCASRNVVAPAESDYRLLSYRAEDGQFTLEHRNLEIVAACAGNRMGKNAEVAADPESCYQLSKKVGESIPLREGKVLISPIIADLTYEIRDSRAVTTLPGTDHFAEEYLRIVSKRVKK